MCGRVVQARPLDELAELWRRAPDGAVVGSCSVLTTVPDAVVGGLHDHMPVILDERDLEAWLDPTTTPARLAPLLRPQPAMALDARPVSLLVYSVRNDGPELVRPISDPALPFPWSAPGGGGTRPRP